MADESIGKASEPHTNVDGCLFADGINQGALICMVFPVRDSFAYTIQKIYAFFVNKIRPGSFQWVVTEDFGTLPF